jgi:hypothetical protein
LKNLKGEAVDYHELLEKVLMKEEVFADHLRLLSKYEIIAYDFRKAGLFISAPNIKPLMEEFYESFIKSYENCSKYFEILIEKQKPKSAASTIYYDFPVKGRAIKKVKLTNKFFETIEGLAEMLKKDFSLNES